MLFRGVAMYKIPILSFFTGGGFFDLGFHNQGYNIIWTNEISENFAKVYKSGMTNYLNKPTKITEIKPIEELDSEFIKNSVKKKIKNKVWGIIGGSPCPDFSVGGKNKGKNGEKGILTKIYINKIIELEPFFFVFENVKGLITTEKHRIFFLQLKEKIDKKYKTGYKILNALEYGVPQNRERVLMIGFHKDVYEKLSKTYKDINTWFPEPIFNDAKNKYDWPTENNSFGKELKSCFSVPEELTVAKHILSQEIITRKVPNSDEYFNPKSEKFYLIPEGDDKRKSFKRLHRYRYSPTMAYGNNEVHLHPTEARRLSVREALRLQTVPDTYVIDKNIPLTTKFKVIANGVSVKLAENVAGNLRRILIDLIKKK